jgi:hypothetical protein
MNPLPILPRTPGTQAAQLPSETRLARTFAAILTVVALLASAVSRADVSVDWLYDFRHVMDPQDNPNDFPVVELKVFFPQSFGSFFLKQEIDLDGAHHNVSQINTELSQSIKLGAVTLGGSPLLVRVGYAGGLGLFNDAGGGFTIQNAYELGLAYAFQVRKAFCDVSLSLRDTSFAKPSYDPMLTLYAGRYFLDDRVLLANSLEAWTTSTAQALGGQGGTSSQSDGGKFASWELESEAWYRVDKHFYVGTYTRTTRNVYAVSNRWVVYPSVGVRYTFDPAHP